MHDEFYSLKEKLKNSAFQNFSQLMFTSENEDENKIRLGAFKIYIVHHT